MTCIAWDGVSLVCDSKVSTRDNRKGTIMDAIKTMVLDKPVAVGNGDQILAISGAGSMTVIESYVDKFKLAGELGIDAEELLKRIKDFSILKGGDNTSIIATGVNAKGDAAVCYSVGQSMVKITKPRVWGSGGAVHESLLNAFSAVDAMTANYGLSMLDIDRCGMPLHVFNPMTRSLVTYHTIPEEVAIAARAVLDAHFRKILNRVYTPPVTPKRRARAK